MAEPTVKHPEPNLWPALLKKLMPELTRQAPAPILLMVSLKELMAEPTVKHPEPILWLALLKKLMCELTRQAPAPILLMVPLKELMAEPTDNSLGLFCGWLCLKS